MSIGKQVVRQKDFSAGEMDDDAIRRDDSELTRAGARQLSNKRLLPSGSAEQRPGRRVLFAQDGRTDEIRVLDGTQFYLCFSSALVRIRDEDGSIVLSSAQPWGADVDLIVWDQYEDTIYLTYPGMQPRTLAYSGGVWAAGVFAFDSRSSGQKRSAFTRFAAGGITMSVNGITGSKTITFSAPVLNASHVGARFRYQGRQMTVTAVTDSQTGTVTVNETLFHGSTLTFGSDPSDHFSVGDVVTGNSSEAIGEVTGFPTGTTMTVSRRTATDFGTTEGIIGPFGRINVTGSTNNLDPPAALTWDEEIMTDYRGWPASVSVDQNRLIFCDFPSLPRAVAWSAIGLPSDFYVGADPDDAMVEFVPGSARVYHVVPGADEFVMTSQGAFYIPISTANPLTPGSVDFRSITVDAVSYMRPATTSEGIVFMSEARDKMIAIRQTGQTAQPYVAEEVTQFHSHLLTLPVVIAACSGASGFTDRCVLVLNQDGTIAVGRYDPTKKWVGWVPWTAGGDGVPVWISATGRSLLLTVEYALGTPVTLVEQVDEAAWLDCQLTYNDAPAALAPGGGQGPAWFLAGATVYLMDGDIPMDTRVVDEDGFLVASEGGDDFTSADLVIGFAWDEIYEPFIPHAPEGRSGKQTLRRRKFGKIAVKATHATGCECANRRVPAWRLGDDRSVAPPTREEVLSFKKAGRTVDPRVEVLKDVPGPFKMNEFSAEITV